MERTFVETRFGRTHVLEMGPRDAKPLIILQGGNCLNPMTLLWFSPLLNGYRVIAPDTIGHPGFSDETRISAQDESFALWVMDIQNHYGWESCAFIGPSFGGGIILRVAAHMPERIACSVLVSPAGIHLGSKMNMIQHVLLPLLCFKLTSSQRALQKIADSMSAGHMSETDKWIIGEIFQSVALEHDMPKIAEKDELTRYSAPTLLIAGKHDLFFPGEGVQMQANKIIPNLRASHIYDMGHFPSAEGKQSMNLEIQKFLRSYYVRD
ncbi:alpha/beta fold hydrolase [Brevibacillus migulae]|uniref:alpha/beta fold hydrolase n=1 Tax=Brevibacillus migulae TaxID=1644114 RepID=UPI001F3C066D|nr:alpha/beta hydrolase [Brevibacillus migulae]